MMRKKVSGVIYVACAFGWFISAGLLATAGGSGLACANGGVGLMYLGIGVYEFVESKKEQR
jgi:hypothetical protein